MSMLPAKPHSGTPALDAVQKAVDDGHGYFQAQTVRKGLNKLVLRYHGAEMDSDIAGALRTTLVEDGGKVHIYQSLHGATAHEEIETRLFLEREVCPAVMAELNAQAFLVRAMDELRPQLPADMQLNLQTKASGNIYFQLVNGNFSTHIHSGGASLHPGGHPSLEVAAPYQAAGWKSMRKIFVAESLIRLGVVQDVTDEMQQVGLLADHLTRLGLPEGWSLEHRNTRHPEPTVMLSHTECYFILGRKDGEWSCRMKTSDPDADMSMTSQEVTAMARLVKVISELPSRLVLPEVTTDVKTEPPLDNAMDLV